MSPSSRPSFSAMNPTLRHVRIAGVSIGTCVLVACRQAPPPDARMIPVWMQTLYGAVRVERLSPPVASRVFTYASAALYFGIESARSDRPATAELMNQLPELPKATD